MATDKFGNVIDPNTGQPARVRSPNRNMGGLMGSQPMANTGMGMTVAERTGFRNPDFNLSDMGGGGLRGNLGPRADTVQRPDFFDPRMAGRGIADGLQLSNTGGMAVSQPAYDQPAYDSQTGLGGLFNNVNNNRVQGNMGNIGGQQELFDYALNNRPADYQAPINNRQEQGNMGGGGYIGVMGGFDDFGNIMGSGAANDAREQHYRNIGLPMNNGVNNMANPYTTDVLTGPAASTSGPSDTMAYGGALLGGLLGGDVSGALQAAGGYYAGQQGIEGAMATGQAGLGLGEAMGKRAYDQSQFRPFGVTSNLANVQTTPEGGVNLDLSQEQQAMQQQLLGQSRGLFGQVGADPAAAQAALYEQIRATQQPEEERQRLQMQENLFSSGRGGVQTAMYGGTPEQMAYEKARQESMLNANLAARTQSQAEQLQAGQLGGMLQQAGYNPQRQAIDLFGASGVPSQLAAKGQLGGAELQSQAGGRGLESYMQGANMANLLQQQQLQGLMTGAVGKPLTAQEQLMNAMIGRLGGTPIEAGGGMLGGVLDWGKELLGFGSDPVTRIDGGGVYVNGQGDGYNPAPQDYLDSLNTPIDPADYDNYNPYA